MVSTNYDVATGHLAAAAADLVTAIGPAGGLMVLDARSPSNASAIHRALTGSPRRTLVFYGHGSKKSMRIVAQDLNAAFDATNQGHLANRMVCALCCHSTTVLAVAATSHSATVVGFKAALRIPSRGRGIRQSFRQCLNMAPRAIHAGQNAHAAKSISEAQFRAEARRLLSGTISERVAAVTVFDWNANQLDVLP